MTHQVSAKCIKEIERLGYRFVKIEFGPNEHEKPIITIVDDRIKDIQDKYNIFIKYSDGGD